MSKASSASDEAGRRELLGMSALLVGSHPSDQNTLRRGIAALWHLSMSDSLSVTELANLLPCDKSQASRVLKVLAEYGMVTRDPDTQRYALGWLVYAISTRVSGRQMVSIAGPVVRQLAARTGFTCWLAARTGKEVLTLYTSSPKGGQVVVNEWAGGVPPGGVVPLHCTASGRALMYGLDDNMIDDLLDGADFHAAGPNAPRSADEVRGRIDVERRQGYSFSVDEIYEGTSSIAVPVNDGIGSPVMCIGLTGRTSDVTSRESVIAHDVVTAGRFITGRLFAERTAARGAATWNQKI